MQKKIKWGIIGPGRIANNFVKGLQKIEDAEIYAVASRTKEKAFEFGDKYNIAKRYGSYEELVNDKEVDAVYIATPHQAHKDCAILCLKKGIAVLCEKPITVNSKEALELISIAKENNTFLMEAMWTRFLPAIVKIREIINSKAIGDIKMMRAEFGFKGKFDREGRLFNPMLAGGALLDVGIYTVSFASMIFKTQPSVIKTSAYIGETNVDEYSSTIFEYDNGKIAVLLSSITASLSDECCIFGTEGKILINQFWRSKEFTLFIDGMEPQKFSYEDVGYNYEAIEVMKCIKQGKKQSDIMPLDESLEIMKTMDRIRNAWSLIYPFE